MEKRFKYSADFFSNIERERISSIFIVSDNIVKVFTKNSNILSYMAKNENKALIITVIAKKIEYMLLGVESIINSTIYNQKQNKWDNINTLC